MVPQEVIPPGVWKIANKKGECYDHPAIMIYLFYGEDQFSLQEELERKRLENNSEWSPGAFIRIEAARGGFNLDEVLNAARAFSMFGEKQLILVSSLLERLAKTSSSTDNPKPKNAKGKPRNLSPRERFLEFIPEAPSTADLFLVEQKVAKNDPVFKAIEKQGVAKEFAPIKDWALQRWIEDRAKKEEVQLAPRVSALLAEHLGGNLFALHNELQKLAAYAGQGQVITPEMVELLTAQVNETSIFRLTEALSKRNLLEALRQLNRLRNESLQNRSGFTRQTFAIICREIFNLARISDMAAARHTKNEIASTLGLHPFVVEKNLPLVRSFKPGKLEALYHTLAEMDFADKRGRVDLNYQLELLLAEICA